MRLKTKLLGASVLAAASLGIAGPASAAPICVPDDASFQVCVEPVTPTCVGTEGTIVVCVEPLGPPLIEDCIYTGGPTCTPVSVPGPSIWCAGRLGPACSFSIG